MTEIFGDDCCGCGEGGNDEDEDEEEEDGGRMISLIVVGSLGLLCGPGFPATGPRSIKIYWMLNILRNNGSDS